MEETARILIVDDNPEIREVVNILLAGEGYDIDEAADGRKAIEKVHKYNYDLIILDVMMPNLNGFLYFKVCRQKSGGMYRSSGRKGTVSDYSDEQH